MLSEIIRNKALDFEEAIKIISEIEQNSLDIIKELKILQEKEDLQNSDIESLINRIKLSEEIYLKYGYKCPYGYPEISIIDELQKILEAKNKKKAIEELISKLIQIKYGYGYPQVEENKTDEIKETVNLFNVEIAQVGEWTNKNFKLTLDDLNEIKDNYYKLNIDIPVKIGHAEGFGLPAVGWVKNVRVENNKLVADFYEVPKRIAELIKLGAYRKVSPEIYAEYEKDGMRHGKVLVGVAILGADLPAMKDLKDLEVLYNSDELKNLVITLPDVKENETVNDLLEENIRLKVETFIKDNQTKILPVYTELVKIILTETMKQDKILKFSENGQEKEISLSEAIQEIFKRMPDIIDFTEKAKVQVLEPTDEETLISKFMQEHKISRKDAILKLIDEGKIKVKINQ